MKYFESTVFFAITLSLFILMMMYTKRSERHKYCMIECMGNDHTEEAYKMCASSYDKYTEAFCEPLM